MTVAEASVLTTSQSCALPFQATAGSDVSECLFRTAVAMDGEIASSPFFASARKVSRKDESESFSIFFAPETFKDGGSLWRISSMNYRIG